MSEDIARMSAELASNPDSLVFLRLGEELRVAAQHDAALKIAAAGVERHATLADARDLLGRVLADAGRLREAQDQWNEAVRLEPRSLGARKGLGFLCFKSGDWDAALDNLEIALSIDPSDTMVVQGLANVRKAVESFEREQERLTGPDFTGLEGAKDGMLLADDRGRVLGGGIVDGRGQDRSEEVSAHLAGVVHEATRACKMLGLGNWEWIAGEAEANNLHVTRPTETSLLLLVRDRSIPAGRIAIMADKAVASARQWLQEQFE